MLNENLLIFQHATFVFSNARGYPAHYVNHAIEERSLRYKDGFRGYLTNNETVLQSQELSGQMSFLVK